MFIKRTIQCIRQEGILSTFNRVLYQIYYVLLLLVRLCKKLDPVYAYKKWKWARADRMFDAAWLIQTTGDIPLHKLAIDSENVQHGNRYGPTPRGTFSKMMQQLDAMNLAYESFTFLDLGSGKGRALFLASECPFRRVIGVEFAKELVVATQENIRRYQNPNQRCFQFEVVCDDATRYELPVDNLVIYIYNTFDAEMVNKVLDRIEYSLQEHPRHIIILYLNAVHDAVLEQRKMFEKIFAKEAFSIYGHFSGDDWKR